MNMWGAGPIISKSLKTKWMPPTPAEFPRLTRWPSLCSYARSTIKCTLQNFFRAREAMRTRAESNLTRCAHVYKKYSARINCMKEKRLKRRNMTTQLSISPQRCRNVSFRPLSWTKIQIPRLVEETLGTSLFTTKCRKEEVVDMFRLPSATLKKLGHFAGRDTGDFSLRQHRRYDWKIWYAFSPNRP